MVSLTTGKPLSGLAHVDPPNFYGSREASSAGSLTPVRPDGEASE